MKPKIFVTKGSDKHEQWISHEINKKGKLVISTNDFKLKPIELSDFINNLRGLKENGPSLYDLNLHESMEIEVDGSTFNIIRVVGGWIYRSAKGSTFVPYNNEYDKN